MRRETWYEFIDYESIRFANKIHGLTYRLRERYSDKKEENYLKVIFRLREDSTKNLKTWFQKRAKLGAIYFMDSIALLFGVTMVKTRALLNYFGSTVNQKVMGKIARANRLHWLESSSFLIAVNYFGKKWQPWILARNLKFCFQSRSRKIRAASKARENRFQMQIFFVL